MGTVIKKIISISLFTLLILISLFLAYSIYCLEEDVYKLQNSNDEIANKLDSLNDITNSIWNERAFEKEMKENLAYYLPEGFRSTVVFTGLTPIDLETGQARVTFMHRYKNYSVDFSYSFGQKGWDVEQISEARQLQ